jgi:putative chitinase
MITRADLKRFAPKAKPEYIDALMSGMETLREAGILDSEYRVCHFLTQVGHETGGFRIIRENMRHSVASARKTWPARFKPLSNSDIKRLASDSVKFSDFVYGGRMGNRKGTSDGFDFRGAGFIQTTGRYAFEKYAKALGLPHDDASLARYANDLGILLKFACLEWQESGCNDWSDENDLTKVCKAINTGSATSNIRPVGMDDRKRWFAKAWSIWGEKGKPDVPPPEPPAVSPGAAAVGGTGLIGGGALLTDPAGVTSTAVAVKANAGQLLSGVDLITWGVPVLIVAGVLAFLWWSRKP